MKNRKQHVYTVVPVVPSLVSGGSTSGTSGCNASESIRSSGASNGSSSRVDQRKSSACQRRSTWLYHKFSSNALRKVSSDTSVFTGSAGRAGAKSGKVSVQLLSGVTICELETTGTGGGSG